MNPNTLRFTDRVEEYVKYRPRYPKEVIEILKVEVGLNKDSIVADIGSGTGISTLQFLENGNQIYAVEPNHEMRKAAEKRLAGYLNFTSIDGTAEESGLADESMDIIFCGQAFHWFKRSKSRNEFFRILKGTGHIALAWNQRDNKTRFQYEYEQVLKKYIKKYSKVSHRNISGAEIQEFFFPKTMKSFSLKNY